MKALPLLLTGALFFIMPLGSRASSCGDVMGQVIDLDTRQPVAGAEIIFENYYDKMTVYANEHGYYYANHLPEGRYEMRVTYKQRTFVMRRVKVYDGYSNEVNFFVSAADSLPVQVLETTPDPLIKIFQQNDIVLTDNGLGQPTLSLSEVLMAQPGINIFQGQVYIKGAPARFFVDGTPVLAPAVLNK